VGYHGRVLSWLFFFFCLSRMSRLWHDGVRALQPVHDRTLDLNATIDTLPPMEEAEEEQEEPTAKRLRTGIP
jgi:hypothetical protein